MPGLVIYNDALKLPRLSFYSVDGGVQLFCKFPRHINAAKKENTDALLKGCAVIPVVYPTRKVFDLTLQRCRCNVFHCFGSLNASERYDGS